MVKNTDKGTLDGFAHAVVSRTARTVSTDEHGGIGNHHHVSAKHLYRCASESAWRFNLRQIGEGDRVNEIMADGTGHLRYKDLIALPAMAASRNRPCTWTWISAKH